VLRRDGGWMIRLYRGRRRLGGLRIGKPADTSTSRAGRGPLGKPPVAAEPVRVAGDDRALRYAGGSASARRPTLALTFLNWGKH
jgi:hypothetical protein